MSIASRLDGDRGSSVPRRGVGLLLTPCWEPEPGPAPRRAELLTAAMEDAGLSVRVIAWQPNRPYGRVWKGYRQPVRVEKERGRSVVRVRPVLAPRHWLMLRGLAEGVSGAALTVVGATLARRCRLVVATTPSPFVGVGAAALAGLLRVPFWMDVRDLIWEYAAGLGATGRARRLRGLALWAARRAAAVSTTTAAQAAYLVEHGVPRGRVHAVPNPVDPDWLEATERLAREYAERTSRGGAPLRVLYAGLLGLPQGLDTLLRAAKLLERENVRFALAGDGPDAARLRQLARDLGLSNVAFLGHLDRDRLLEVYEQADVCYAQLREGAGFATAYPTKLLEYMAAGRPVIYGGRGEAADDLQRAGCGVVVAPESPDELCAALRVLASDVSERVSMATAGRRVVQLRRSLSVIRTEMVGLCERVMNS